MNEMEGFVFDGFLIQQKNTFPGAGNNSFDQLVGMLDDLQATAAELSTLPSTPRESG